jgi:hypothetical protein
MTMSALMFHAHCGSTDSDETWYCGLTQGAFVLIGP